MGWDVSERQQHEIGNFLMTHDELLAVLNDVITDDVHHVATQLAHALRAVVEAHAPQNKHEVEFGLAKCDGCYASYPCPTIQVILKELG